MANFIKKPITWIVVGTAALTLAFGSILATVLVSKNKLSKNLTIVKDGQKVDSLDVKDILICPGMSSGYEVSLYSGYADNFQVYMQVEGSKDSVTDLTTLKVFNNNVSYSVNLSKSFGDGKTYLCRSFLSEKDALNLTVEYDFSSEITEDMIKPVDLTISFEIATL